MNILVFGAGTFGTAIANELSVNKENNVILFSRNQDKVEEINRLHTNISCFPNKHLINSLSASNQNQDLRDADVILIAVPSSVIIESLSFIKSYINQDVLIVNLSKGLMPDGVTIVDTIKQILATDNVVSLKGPSFAVEVLDHSHTLLTLGYNTQKQHETIDLIIKDTALYIDSTTDINGVEVLSVLKNIYALFLGVIDAKYNSPNTRFMILTKAFSEIRILLNLLAGSEATLFLACGFGDLCLTSLNDLSRNRTLGLLIGKGFFSADYKANSVILEGLKAIEMLNHIVDDKNRKDLPIFNSLYNFFAQKQSDFVIEFNDLVN